MSSLPLIILIAVIIIYNAYKRKRNLTEMDDVEKYKRENPKDSSPYRNPYTSGKVDLNKKNERKKKLIDYFRNILRRNFQKYYIRENVSPRDYNWETVKKYKTDKYYASKYYGDFYPSRYYDFVFEKDGKPLLLIDVLTNGEGNLSLTLNSELTAQSMSIPLVKFYESMANEETYIVDRINKILS